MERSAWDYRKKVEVDRVLDLSKNLQEKYGCGRGWQFGLRFSQERDSVLEYKDPISFTNGTGSPLCARLKDDRSTPV